MFYDPCVDPHKAGLTSHRRSFWCRSRWCHHDANPLCLCVFLGDSSNRRSMIKSPFLQGSKQTQRVTPESGRGKASVGTKYPAASGVQGNSAGSETWGPLVSKIGVQANADIPTNPTPIAHLPYTLKNKRQVFGLPSTDLSAWRGGRKASTIFSAARQRL